VFTNHAAQKRERETQLQEIVAEQHRNDLRTQEVKRNKRQHERFVKHQKKKQRKAEQVQQAEQVPTARPSATARARTAT
jgi:TolA-binding protein